MKKVFKTLLAVSLMLLSFVPFVNVKAEDITTLKMYQIGSAPVNVDELMEFVNNVLREEIQAEIDLEYIGWGEYEEKMSVMTNSGEKYDIAFATNYLDNAQKGAYADLTDLMDEHAKETMEMLDQAYIDGNSIDGRLYAFPVNGNVYAEQYYTFNPTFLEKYDLDLEGIESMEDIEPLLATVKEGEPNIDVIAAGAGWRVGHDFDFVMDESVPLGVDMLGDTAKIINPYEEGDAFLPDLRTMHEFYQKGYAPSDAATSDIGYPLEADTWFMRRETVGPRDYGNYLLRTVSGKDLEIVRYSQVPLKSVAQARMANFVVAQNSDNKEKAVQALNIINSNPDVLNTLVYGLEGENWERNEDDTIKLLENYNNPDMTHMSAWNTGNADILYRDENITDEQIQTSEEGMENAVASSLLGFNFVTDNVQTEIANVSSVMAQYMSDLHTGTVDPDEVVPELLEALEKAGIKTVQEEMQRQFDEFLGSQE